jgi:hypothetical protein
MFADSMEKDKGEDKTLNAMTYRKASKSAPVV